MKPTSLAEVKAVLQRMSGNAADAVALAANLPDMIGRLEPASARLMSRPHFERATLWTYSAQFENVPTTGEAPPDVIRVQHDLWVRGVECQVIFGPEVPDPALYEAIFGILQSTIVNSSNLRHLVELNWRVDARQGFISTGTSETMESAALITGDGTYSAPLDWRLQKDQTIEVRCRSLLRYLVPAELLPDVNALLRWVVVTFWGEALQNPSVR